MANPEHLAKLNEGVQAWNDWRKQQPEVTPDLNAADLSGKDLSYADLRAANLEHAKLCRADLYQANLSGADLWHVNFTDAHLSEAKLRETNLRAADLSSLGGALQTEQLAGSDLTGAKLPDQLKKLYDSLENVKGISESARKIFLAVLAACLYCWLTIATTTDVNLITNRASSPLPIIQTAIPIVGFYVVAPLLILCVYFYFHFYLQKLWEELGSLPAVFPDGRPLHTKVDPWLLNDLVRAHLPQAERRPPLPVVLAIVDFGPPSVVDRACHHVSVLGTLPAAARGNRNDVSCGIACYLDGGSRLPLPACCGHAAGRCAEAVSFGAIHLEGEQP